MRLSRRPRGRIVAVLILALLFLQMATAVHACLRAVAPPLGGHEACAAHERMHAEAAAAQAGAGALCQAHCDHGNLSVNQLGHAAAPDLLPQPQLWAVLDWKPLAAAPAPALQRPGALRSGEPPPGTPPIYLSLLVLRR
ncbi:MAG: hypothetical protein KGN16_26070 [Burkholderiales bacterium]|nr:hypothetical protein [Burkholderiales bacterium]